MTTLRTLAKAGGYEVIQDVNGIVAISKDKGTYVCDADSAYELIRNEVKEPEIRAELLRQWAKAMNEGSQS